MNTRGMVRNCQPFGRPFARKCTGRMSGSDGYRQTRYAVVAAMASTLTLTPNRVSADSCRKLRARRAIMIRLSVAVARKNTQSDPNREPASVLFPPLRIQPATPGDSSPGRDAATGTRSQEALRRVRRPVRVLTGIADPDRDSTLSGSPARAIREPQA